MAQREISSPPAPLPTAAAPHVRAKRLIVPTGAQLTVAHYRSPQPLHFPVEAEVPEGFTHLHIRTFLFQLLTYILGDEHTVGSDQFIYWNARDTGLCLAPDAFVKLGRRPVAFGALQTWQEGGAPELCVEIVSPNDGSGLALDENLGRYHEMGTRELLRFDPRAEEGRRLRAWDRESGDWVERIVEGDSTPCRVLGLVWVVRVLENVTAQPLGLRLTTASGELLLDARERADARAAEANARAAEANARAAEANARVKELEALLAKRES